MSVRGEHTESPLRRSAPSLAGQQADPATGRLALLCPGAPPCGRGCEVQHLEYQVHPTLQTKRQGQSFGLKSETLLKESISPLVISIKEQQPVSGTRDSSKFLHDLQGFSIQFPMREENKVPRQE